jgi:hypothetical protein
MGSYGAYQREAREIVDELRRRGVLEQVMNGTHRKPQDRITPAQYWADLNERMPD